MKSSPLALSPKSGAEDVPRSAREGTLSPPPLVEALPRHPGWGLLAPNTPREGLRPVHPLMGERGFVFLRAGVTARGGRAATQGSVLLFR